MSYTKHDYSALRFMLGQVKTMIHLVDLMDLVPGFAGAIAKRTAADLY
jgi:hypothetical protein